MPHNAFSTVYNRCGYKKKKKKKSNIVNDTYAQHDNQTNKKTLTRTQKARGVVVEGTTAAIIIGYTIIITPVFKHCHNYKPAVFGWCSKGSKFVTSPSPPMMFTRAQN